MTVGVIEGETLKSAIAKKIVASLAPATVKIYKEPQVQGMVLPAIFIRTLNVSHEKQMGDTYHRAYQMNVRYHPTTNDLSVNQTLEAMAHKLLMFLTWVYVPIFLGNYNEEDEPIEEMKPVVGRQIDYSITDGVLQLFVTYNLRGKILPPDGAKMQQIEVNQL